ncbi:MAG: M48 family metallopeptidase [Planctomycetota bacterium]
MSTPAGSAGPTRNTMDFFGAEEAAHRKTGWLVLYFALCVAVIVLGVYFVSWGMYKIYIEGNAGKTHHRQGYEEELPPPTVKPPNVPLFVPVIFVFAVGGTLAVIGGGMAFKMMQLASGGSAVAEMLGGRLLAPNTRDPDERRLLNVVEEMAIAAGIHVPPVYVMDREEGINAFAAGNNPNEAVVSVTAGTLRLLNRDELQGVIGHEFSHILNGDMRTNIRLIGVLFGILGLYVLGLWMIRISFYSSGRMYASNDNDNSGMFFVVLGFALMAIGGVGLFFGKLIKAAISRQREFLADASSVQFTRNPAGIAGALKKIGGYDAGGRLKTHAAEETAHMFFAEGLADAWFDAMATHPPLEERIRRVEPGFDGKFPDVQPLTDLRTPLPHPSERDRRVGGPLAAMPMMGGAPGLGGSAGMAGGAGLFLPGMMAGGALGLQGGGAAASAAGGSAGDSGQRRATGTLNPDQVLANIGRVSPEQMKYAQELMFRMPAPLLDLAHDPLGAAALMLGLLLDADAAVRSRQLEFLQQHIQPAIQREVTLALKHVLALDADMRLKLLDLSLPALRQLAPAQYTELRNAVGKLIEADGRTSLFEFLLTQLLRQHLDRYFGATRPPTPQYYGLGQLSAPLGLLLSYVAYAGTVGVEAEDAAHPLTADAKAAALQAFRAGAAMLSLDTNAAQLLPREQLNFDALSRAMTQFRLLAPALKKRLLAACAAAISADRVISTEEAELFRAIAAAIDCPAPPLFTTHAA